MDPVIHSQNKTTPPYRPLEEEGPGYIATNLTLDEYKQQLMEVVEGNPNTTDKTRELAKGLVEARREVDNSEQSSQEARQLIEDCKGLLAQSQQIVEEKEHQTAELQQEVNLLQSALIGASWILSFFTTQDNSSTDL